MTVIEARAILGGVAEKYSDEEIVKVVKQLSLMADIAIDSAISKDRQA